MRCLVGASQEPWGHASSACGNATMSAYRLQGAYILNVVVDEDSRGQGVGKALMREAMSRAVSAGLAFES